MENTAASTIKPVTLKPGNTIGVAAPAGPFERDRFDRGVAVLEAAGYRVHVPDGTFHKKDYLAGDDRHRADQLNGLFADPAIHGILCARGGFGAMRILEYIDFDLVRTHPKVFVGFSDISILLHTFYARAGLVTFHGPMATTLAASDRASRNGLFAAVSAGRKLKVASPNTTTLKSGKAVGTVLGGNLASLCHLLGTPFAPRFDNAILILEDIGEAPYKIDRMMTQMKLAGCFDNLAGMVLGEFQDCGPVDRIHAIVHRAFRNRAFPILAGLGFGHGDTNITLPIGLTATLDADHHFLLYHQSATLDNG